MLGLQQSVRSNAIITCYYIAIQLSAGMHGFRMGYANGLFFLVHEGFDGVTSLVDTLLDWLVLLPTRPQATCNRCEAFGSVSSCSRSSCGALAAL